MNKKTRDKIAKKAAETVKARHTDLGEAVAKVGKALGEKKEKEPKTPSGLPKLPPMPSMARARKLRPMVPCACGGCGATTRSTWAPGHDAYCKGWALRVERNIAKMSDVPAEVVKGVRIVMATHKKVAEANPHKANLKVVKKEGAETVTEGASGASDPAVGE